MTWARGAHPSRRSDGRPRTEHQLKHIRRRARELVDALDIPVPFDIEKLCTHIGSIRGTSIRLHPYSARLGLPCGLFLSLPGEDIVVYETQTSPLHQEQIILHELGHLLCDHHGRSLGVTEATARLLFPHLHLDMVNTLLGRARGHYSEPEEQEAEIIASMILQRARRAKPATARTLYSDIAARIEHTLE